MLNKFAFTTSAVERLDLEPGKIDGWAWDTEQPGLGVRMRRGKNGVTKAWQVAYRFAGEERKFPLGDLSAYTLADARHRVYEMRRSAADGIDPREQKAARVSAAVKAASTPVFAEYAEHYLRRREKDLSANYYREVERYLASGAHLEPFKKKRLDQISKAMIAERLNFLQDTGIDKPSAHAAQGARMALLGLFKMAVQEGHVAENPVGGTRQPLAPKKQIARERTLTAAELVKVWNASDPATDYGKITRLAILLGSRRTEIGAMRWSEIDAAGNWTLPKERAKNGVANMLPLPPAALELIRSMPQHEGRELVFGGRSADGFTLWSNAKRKLDAEVQLAEPWTFHDLRRTLVTGMHDIGVAPHIVEAVVNHVNKSSVHNKHYNHARYAAQKGEALRQWAEHVLGLVSGKPSNVVPFAA